MCNTSPGIYSMHTKFFLNILTKTGVRRLIVYSTLQYLIWVRGEWVPRSVISIFFLESEIWNIIRFQCVFKEHFKYPCQSDTESTLNSKSPHFSSCAFFEHPICYNNWTRRIRDGIYNWQRDYQIHEFILGSNKLAQLWGCFSKLLESFEIKHLTGDCVRRSWYFLLLTELENPQKQTIFLTAFQNFFFPFSGSFWNPEMKE